MSITITDLLNSQTSDPTTVYPTYSVSPNSYQLTKGSTVIYSIITTGLADNTVLYWYNSGTTVGKDFTDGTNEGEIVIVGNTGEISKTISDDMVSVNDSSIIFELRTGSTTGPIVATSDTVTVSNPIEIEPEPTEQIDIQTVLVTTGIVDEESEYPSFTLFSADDPTPSYEIIPNNYFPTEGSTVIYNITTTNIVDQTVLYWSNNGTTVGADFTDGLMGGPITIVDNTAQLERTMVADMLSEGGESIVLRLRADSVTGLILATAPTVVVQDTSQSPVLPPGPGPDGKIPIETIIGGFATIGYTGSQGSIGYTGSQGSIGYTGSQGIQGDGLKVLGKLNDTVELPYPYTGIIGDAYFVENDLYTWNGEDWVFIGDLTGYTGSQGDPGPNLINTATDVDVEEIQDGSLLIYKENTAKWTASVLLDKQIMDGGHY